MPERTVYSLTPAGHEMLGELVKKFLRTEERPEWLFGLGIAFICGAPREKVLEALQFRKQAVTKHLNSLAENLKAYKSKIPFNWYMLIEHAHTHIQLELDWLHQLIDSVKKVERWTPEWVCAESAEQTESTAKLTATSES